MIELPQGYYLTNFLDLVDYVYEQYEDLLNEEELNFFSCFKALSLEAQYLYLRMLTRKGLVFRKAKLNYAEIPDIESAANELAENELIEIDPPLTAESIVHIFSKAEWIKILTQLDLDKATFSTIKKLPRHDLDELLIDLDKEFDLYSIVNEPVYLLNQSELFETFKLLFFGNLNQDLTEFVLRDLGLFQFEDYLIDKDSRLFSDRSQVDNYLAYYSLIEDLEDVLLGEADEILDFHQKLPDESKQDKTLSRRIQRVNLHLARQLERLDDLDQALLIYQKCKLEPSRERQARIFIKQEAISKCLHICQEIISAPLTESEQNFAHDFGYRMAKKWQIDWSKPLTYKPEVETIILENRDDNVEVIAAEHFQNFGSCFYVENGLFLSFFGLHFWDVIFAPIKGAFTNPFQYRPHDLYEDDFLEARSKIYQPLLDQIKDKQTCSKKYKERIDTKQGIATPFVFWELLQEDFVDLAFERIPVEHFQAIYERIWRDVRANRSGFPDLIHFPDEGGYQLIEIKGPGDKLQKNQIRWMQYFSENNIPHKVVHVEWK